MSAEAEPVWIDHDAVLIAHDIVVAETGGAMGVRDHSLLESAIMRPLNRFHYESERDLVRLAATYGVGVAKNHPFVDGNKRASFLCLNLFLEANGLMLTAGDDDATATMYAVAAGEFEEAALAAWIQANSART